MEQFPEMRIGAVDVLDRWQHDAAAGLKACLAELPEAEADTPAITAAICGIDDWCGRASDKRDPLEKGWDTCESGADESLGRLNAITKIG